MKVSQVKLILWNQVRFFFSSKPISHRWFGFTTPYRLDRNQNVGAYLCSKRGHTSKSLTEIKLVNKIGSIFIEINLRSKK